MKMVIFCKNTAYNYFMKNKIKKIFNKKVIKRLLIFIFAILLFICLPRYNKISSDELSNIFGVFVGEKASYQGVIEVWNIDTFDSGIAPKSNYLSDIANVFEKKNKGIYVMIKNLTETECLNLLNCGYKPDLFSCSYGVAEDIKDYIQPLSNLDGVEMSQNLVNAGKIGDYSYGLPWCYGSYFVISSNNHLKNADFFKKFSIDENDSFKLSDYICDLGYKIEKKNNKVKIVNSVSYGNNKYLMPKYAFNSYNSRGLNNNLDFAINEKVKTNSTYDAYIDFISNKSVMLLGSQRDAVRINGRVESGKLSDVYFEKINTFTDLIQFVFMAKDDDLIKRNYKEIFVKMLVDKNNQQKLEKVGLASINQNLDNFSSVMIDITLDFNSICKINNVFLPKSEIFNSQ